jgi:hypothetical protein
MKIKPYTKLTKRNLKVNPFIILPLPLPKPKIPFRLFLDVHIPNLYQPPKVIVEVVDPLAGPLVAGPLLVEAVVGPLVAVGPLA